VEDFLARNITSYALISPCISLFEPNKTRRNCVRPPAGYRIRINPLKGEVVLYNVGLCACCLVLRHRQSKTKIVIVIRLMDGQEIIFDHSENHLNLSFLSHSSVVSAVFMIIENFSKMRKSDHTCLKAS
jgi:hypothetical protein